MGFRNPAVADAKKFDMTVFHTSFKESRSFFDQIYSKQLKNTHFLIKFGIFICFFLKNAVFFAKNAIFEAIFMIPA